jgi:hypothetical protein
MRIRIFGYGLGLCVVAASLAACGSAQPPVGATGAIQQNRGSWILPQTSGHKSILIYAGGVYGSIYVYDYFTGKQVGELKINAGYGACVDAKGNVYIGQSNDTTLEYAHGGTKILKTYSTAATPDGCSIDAKDDLAITNGGNVTVFAHGDPSKGKTYSQKDCGDLLPLGYDTKGNLLGLADATLPVTPCVLLAGAKSLRTLSMKGFTINAPGHTMWDGKYFALTDENANKKATDGIVDASLSGKTLTFHHEAIFTDTCNGTGTSIPAPFILGEKNTPVNGRQGRIVVGINLLCTGVGIYEIEFWHYPQGGNPFKVYKVKTQLGSVETVSIGT